MTSKAKERIERALETRFGATIPVDPDQPGLDGLAMLLEQCSHRRWKPDPVPADLLKLLCACALAAPSKSDLQQGDIVHVADAGIRTQIMDLIPDMPWMKEAPEFLVFCANNRRQRQLAQWRGKPFPNDHLDAYMNSTVDAAIVMTTFIHAAAAVGLGCCAISAVRDDAKKVSELLALPDWVYPICGMCVGYPVFGSRITPRLPLDVTLHTNRFDETGIAGKIDGYDHRRHELRPYPKQRSVEIFGSAEFYGWSEDKARQYGVPERTDFGEFIRGKGFKLG
jgi:FMN reductase [NAD(P)H]